VKRVQRTGAKTTPVRGLAPAMVCAVWFLIFVLLPIGSLLFAAHPSVLWHGLGREMLLSALRLSLITSASATILCAAIGVPAGYLLSRFDFPGKFWIDSVVDLPLTLPPVVAGVALLMTYGARGTLNRVLPFHIDLGFTMAAVVLAQAFVASPFMVRAAQSGFDAVDPELSQASATLGAGQWTTFRRIYLPLAGPALLSGATLTWARALSEFGATLMFAGNLPGVTQTMPLAVMTAMETGLDLTVALAAFTLVVAAILLIGSRFILRPGRISHAGGGSRPGTGAGSEAGG